MTTPAHDDRSPASPDAERATELSGEPAGLSGRELAAIFGFWTFFALLTAANRLLDVRGGGIPVRPWPPAAMAFVESYVWALLTPPIFWLASRSSVLQGRERWLRVALCLAAGILVAIGVDLFMDAVRAHYFPVPRRRGGPPAGIWTLARLRYLNELMVYFAVLSAGFARDYFRRYQARQAEAAYLTAHAAHLQAQLAEARLVVLRTQLNPHFLFNTLHAISSLVERDPRGVRRMIARLSELLRYTLDGASDQEIPLREELELTRRYLEIMQIRFQGALEVQVDVEPDVGEALVPNLLLQPLVENAIKHGTSQRERGGRVELRAARMGEELVLRVVDNGPGGESVLAPAERGTGVGLRNTRARLEELYGDEQRFTLRRGDGETVAEVVLPYHTRADLRTAVLSPAT